MYDAGSGYTTESLTSLEDATINATTSGTVTATTVFVTTLVITTDMVTPEGEDGIEPWIWAVIGVAGLLLVVGVILIIVCCVRRCRRRKPPAPVEQEQEGPYGNLDSHGKVDVGKAPRNSLPEGFRPSRGNDYDGDDDDDYADEYLKPDQTDSDNNDVYENVPGKAPLTAVASPRIPPAGNDFVNPAFQLPPAPPVTPVARESLPDLPLPPPPEQLPALSPPPFKPLPLPPIDNQNIGLPRPFQLPLPTRPPADPAQPVRLPTPRPSPAGEENPAFIPPSIQEELPPRSPPPAPVKNRGLDFPSKLNSPVTQELNQALMVKMKSLPSPSKPQIKTKKKNKKEIPVPQRVIDENEVIREAIPLGPSPEEDYGGEYEEMEPTKSHTAPSFLRSQDADYGGSYEEMSPANTMNRDTVGRESPSSSDSESYEVMSPVIDNPHVPRKPAEHDLEHRLPMPLPNVHADVEEDFGDDYEEISGPKPRVAMKPQTARKPRVAPKQKTRPLPPPKNSKPPDDDFGEEYTNTNADISSFVASQRPPPSMPKPSPSMQLITEQQDKGDPVYMNLPNVNAKPSEHYRNLPNPPQTEQVGGYTDSRRLKSWQRTGINPR
ncbi:uncharacterized protein [Diadema antillarum]|uniref:uncharacterized protein n=1 Tax=Diadema antillarum TaxID=105358 RepID=UPI003A8892B9